MIGDYDRQNAFLLTLVKTVDKATTKCPKKGVKSKPRSKTRQYTINGIDVCKEVFKAVFSISNGRLGRLLLAHDRNPNEIPKERRGAKRMQRIDPLVVIQSPKLWKSCLSTCLTITEAKMCTVTLYS